jgi:hypothetical protein
MTNTQNLPATSPQSGEGGAALTQPATNEPAANGGSVDLSSIDLTQVPAFREYQSRTDRRLAEAERRAQEAQALLAQQQQDAQRRELESLRDLDPAEQAERYRQLYERQQQELQRQQYAAQFEAQMRQIVADAGLEWNDARLAQAIAFGGSPQGVVAISTAVARAVKEDGDALRLALAKEKEEATKRAQQAATQARNDVLVNSGALSTSNAGGNVRVPDDRAELVNSFKKRFTNLRGTSPESPAYINFTREMRANGVSWADLGY